MLDPTFVGDPKYIGHLLIFMVNILFAINISISKSLLPIHVTPFGLTLLRMLFACVMFWLTSLFLPKEHVSKKDLALLFFCSMTGIAINQGLFIYGLTNTSPIDASIISTASPIFVMVLAAIILNEPITRMKAFGVLVGATGAIGLILASGQVTSGKSNLLGNMLCMLSSFSYSIYLVIAKPITKRYSSVTIMKWMFLFSTLVIFPFTYDDLIETPAFHGTINSQYILSILYVLFFCNLHPLSVNSHLIEEDTSHNHEYVQLHTALRRIHHSHHGWSRHIFVGQTHCGCICFLRRLPGNTK